MSCNNKKTSNNSKDIDKSVSALKSDEHDILLLVGTYTENESDDGIYLYKFNIKSGESELLHQVKAENPSYMVLDKDEKFLYAVGENGGDKSSVSSFALDKAKGELKYINSQFTGGADPCYIEIDDNSNHIFTANYTGGSISVFSTNEDGKISPAEMVLQFEGKGSDSVRQSKPHLHSVRLSPDNRYLFATDLGTDKIYRFDLIGSVFEGQPSISETSLTEVTTPPATGPRHFDFHPNGQYLYLLGELSGEIIVYDYDNGDLIEKQIVVSDSLRAGGSGDIHVSPDGRFLYSSNRLKEDGLAIFSINSDDGTLTKTGYQHTAKHPRNFAITPNGKLLLVAGRDDNKIEIYSIDSETGLLSNTNRDIDVGKPVCIKFAIVH